YDGTAAEFLAITHHPALRAIAPRFSLFDAYADVAFPGGIQLERFTQAWSFFNACLDAGRLDRAFGAMARIQARALSDALGPVGDAVLGWTSAPRLDPMYQRLVRLLAHGVRPVTEEELGLAQREHRDNFDVHRGAQRVAFRDDEDPESPLDDGCIDVFSPHHQVDSLRRSGVAVLHYSGWNDGAYQRSAIHRYLNVGGPLLLGPWDHGGTQNTSPYATTRPTQFDHDGELLRFFDHHLRGRPYDVSPVRFYVAGEERWRRADRWPVPTEDRTFGLQPGGQLLELNSKANTSPGTDSFDRYYVDPGVGSGPRSRWDSLLGVLPPVGSGRRRERDQRLLVYRSEPLTAPLTAVGEVTLELRLAINTDDSWVFVYLEDEPPQGPIQCVTEGPRRAQCARSDEAPEAGTYRTVVPQPSYRRADAIPFRAEEPTWIRITLLPTAWRFAPGNRIRIALSGADDDHFAAPPHASIRWDVFHDSQLIVPALLEDG
ncbi:MAG: CocE/NonD family hydrolase, partial [Myxococcota bacterium]